jgi:hypothetical protein
MVSIEAPAHRIDALFRGLDNDPLILSPPLGNYRGFTFMGGVSWSGSASSHSGFQLNGGDRSFEPTCLTLAPEIEIIAARSCGWPLRCLESRASRSARGWSSSWQLHLAGPEPLSGSVFAATLPLRPLWPGILLDSLAFTAAWASLLATPAALRWIRTAIRSRRKGRCPNCGYDLKGLPGPTCPNAEWPVVSADPIKSRPHQVGVQGCIVVSHATESPTSSVC